MCDYKLSNEKDVEDFMTPEATPERDTIDSEDISKSDSSSFDFEKYLNRYYRKEDKQNIIKKDSDKRQDGQEKQ